MKLLEIGYRRREKKTIVPPGFGRFFFRKFQTSGNQQRAKAGKLVHLVIIHTPTEKRKIKSENKQDVDSIFGTTPVLVCIQFSCNCPPIHLREQQMDKHQVAIHTLPLYYYLM